MKAAAGKEELIEMESQSTPAIQADLAAKTQKIESLEARAAFLEEQMAAMEGDAAKTIQ